MRRLRRLVQQKTARQAEGVFVAEGVKVVVSALEAGAELEAIYFSDAAGAAGALIERAGERGVRAFRLAEGVMERVADTVTPQPVIAVVRNVDVPLAAVTTGALVLVCVDVRDPGNLGAVLRSGAAAGADAVVCCEGTADVYNPKVVRASAGALFHVPLALAPAAPATLAELGAAGLRRVATVASGGEDYALAALGGRVALVLGNEANGLDDASLAACDAAVSIPMASATESLNVAMAATVLAFEVARRRRLSGDSPPTL